MTEKKLTTLTQESHRRQFAGEDYQVVAIDLADGDEEAFEALCSSPDPGCDCGFCATADWQD